MKVHAPDALKIARAFSQAGDSDTPRLIERIRVFNPSPINTLALFRLHAKDYALIFDDTANDNETYLQEQVAIVSPGSQGRLLTNPSAQVATFGLPYEGKDCYLFVFGSSKKRLDIVLAEQYPEFSRSSWQKHVKAGHVKVNGETILRPKFEIGADAQMEIKLPDAPDHSAKTLPILYQDDDVTVFDKPIDVLTHPKNPLDSEFTVMDMARRFWTDALEEERFGIVHRLDRDTSGVIIVARHLAAYQALKSQFADRQAKKTYLAIVDGLPKQAEAILDLPILRNSAKPGSFMVDAGGKSATTIMKTIVASEVLSYLELQPQTGRTHQLRVHMAYINCPIHGDRLYGRSADRLYLHAHKLEIVLPTGQRQVFTSKLPAAFSQLMPEITDAQ